MRPGYASATNSINIRYLKYEFFYLLKPICRPRQRVCKLLINIMITYLTSKRWMLIIF